LSDTPTPRNRNPEKNNPMQSPLYKLHAEIEQRHWWFVGRRRLMFRLVESIVPPSQETLVVDVGCGTGANLAALAERYQCLGIDASAEAVALARQRHPNVRFLHGLAPDALGEIAPQARLFLLMDVLEHVPDDFEFFSRMLAAAPPGAFFFITVPADEKLWSEHDASFGHYRRYNKDRLERLWQDLPVETLAVSYFNRRLLPIIRFIRAINNLRGKTCGQAGTDFWIPRAPLNLLLSKIFEGEHRRLRKNLKICETVPSYSRQKRNSSPQTKNHRGGYRSGVSLVAVLRRLSGTVSPRSWPADVPPDRHAPPPYFR
jgi:SAM-dependent methyltransferase